MSLENRKRQYKMFMERGQVELAKQQIKGKEFLLKEIEEKPQIKSKGKK
jgi:hypothetical protein